PGGGAAGGEPVATAGERSRPPCSVGAPGPLPAACAKGGVPRDSILGERRSATSLLRWGPTRLRVVPMRIQAHPESPRPLLAGFRGTCFSRRCGDPLG